MNSSISSKCSTTGSSKNHTITATSGATKATRKRGLEAILRESINSLESRSKRASRTRAESTISQLAAACAPRGNPQAGARARLVNVAKSTENSSTPPPVVKNHGRKSVGSVVREPTSTRSSRVCKTQAESAIKKVTATHAPCGDTCAGGTARCTQATNTVDDTETPTSLGMIFKNKRNVFTKGVECLTSYIERNASYEIQKACAMSVMTTAMTAWGCSIIEAASIAAEATSFSEQTIRRWVACYFSSLFHTLSVALDNVTDQDIEDELFRSWSWCYPSL